MKESKKEIYFVEYDRYPNRPLGLLKEFYEKTKESGLDYTKGDRLLINMQSGDPNADDEYQAKLEWLFLNGYLNYQYDEKTRDSNEPFEVVVTLTPKGMEEGERKK